MMYEITTTPTDCDITCCPGEGILMIPYHLLINEALVSYHQYESRKPFARARGHPLSEPDIGGV